MIKKTFLILYFLIIISQLIAQKTPNNIPSNGLIFWMPFNNSCIDESENNLNIEYDEIEYVTDRNNNVNSAIYMNGLNSKIHII